MKSVTYIEKGQKQNLLNHGGHKTTHHWTKPDLGWIKCYYDGSFVNGNIPSKAGWVMRGEYGVFIRVTFEHQIILWSIQLVERSSVVERQV